MCSKEQSQDLGKGVKEKYAVKEITCTESWVTTIHWSTNKIKKLITSSLYVTFVILC
jgi:hypothetical protein